MIFDLYNLILTFLSFFSKKKMTNRTKKYVQTAIPNKKAASWFEFKIHLNDCFTKYNFKTEFLISSSQYHLKEKFNNTLTEFSRIQMLTMLDFQSSSLPSGSMDGLACTTPYLLPYNTYLTNCSELPTETYKLFVAIVVLAKTY